ncbi:hypothetical protein M422DRAFT_34854 [Sphaerobolus stellatus SS14]|uniref:DUF7702 domain-containing protein n=1 Tax=Sphaerobolus stellatus (strain SS14) TaxID=990650 RepID=A0A0C9UJ83_SPHS4|nr:hypothetical protein M422DRAFT_34854 [Sphaerobolus stellatus SS14]
MLNDFGKIAIAEIIFYIPVLLISLGVTFKHGFSRKVGWVLLVIFATIRILGAVLLIITQTQSNPSSGIITTAGIVQSIGLSPLIVATLGFVSYLAIHAFPSLTRPLHLIHILVTIGLILSVTGGIDASPDHSPSDQKDGRNHSKIGSILFLAAYFALAGLQVLLHGVRERFNDNQIKFLNVLSLALPFLFVRVLYTVLAAFTAKSSGPSKFSSISGDWKIYLFMGLLMEYIVVLIYIIGGLKLAPGAEQEGPGKYELGTTRTGSEENQAEGGGWRIPAGLPGGRLASRLETVKDLLHH